MFEDIGRLIIGRSERGYELWNPSLGSRLASAGSASTAERLGRRAEGNNNTHLPCVVQACQPFANPFTSESRDDTQIQTRPLIAHERCLSMQQAAGAVVWKSRGGDGLSGTMRVDVPGTTGRDQLPAFEVVKHTFLKGYVCRTDNCGAEGVIIHWLCTLTHVCTPSYVIGRERELGHGSHRLEQIGTHGKGKRPGVIDIAMRRGELRRLSRDRR